MSVLNDFPDVPGFFGLDLKTCCLLIATLGIVHPVAYVYSCFLSMSYMMITIWILVAFFFAASIALFSGVLQGIPSLLTMWVWYTMVFVCLMILLTIILGVVLAIREHVVAAVVTFFSLLWYMFTIYFIFVVNTHRKELEGIPLKQPWLLQKTQSA